MNNSTAVTPVPEAPLSDDGHGRKPAGAGWYVVNVADAAGWHNASFGSGVSFEARPNRFEQFGVNVHVLEPGQPNCRYHNESDQEAFLVLAGECVLIIEEQERHLRAGDFVHCPPMTRHVFVGAGSSPCAILMMGGRTADTDDGCYPVSELAARHGAGVAEATSDPKVAYADDAPYIDARVDFSWIFGPANPRE